MTRAGAGKAGDFMRKGAGLLALLTAVALGLSGCMLSGREPEAVDEIHLPEPTEEPENMILGETLSGSFNEITLYYPAPDGTSYSTVRRGVRPEAGQSLPEAALSALFEGGNQTTRFLGDTKVLSCEFACGTATVNLSIDARNFQNPQELLAMELSIGNTLLSLEGVRGVNILIGQLSEGFWQLPLGVLTEPVASATADYAQLQAERDRSTQPEGEPVLRNALLYFPTDSGDWLVPELRPISATSGDFIRALIDALKAGPQDEACAIASIPEGVELMDDSPAIRTLSSGERVLDLNFSSTLANYLAFSGLDVWELAGSLSLTMCSFLPELDAVRIMVNGEAISMCELDDGIVRFPDGLIHRQVFSGKIGSTATLFLSNDAGRLQPVRRAVSMRSAQSPRSLLTELLRYAGKEDGTLFFPLPSGIYPEDFLGVQASGGIARVNLSGSFYRSCQGLDEQRERALVYSMINTLCTLQGIRAVRFYVEGRPADTLSGSIYLKSVLLPNPGIVESDAEQAEEDE